MVTVECDVVGKMGVLKSLNWYWDCYTCENNNTQFVQLYSWGYNDILLCFLEVGTKD